MKRIFLESNPLFLGLTIAVSLLHSGAGVGRAGGGASGGCCRVAPPAAFTLWRPDLTAALLLPSPSL